MTTTSQSMQPRPNARSALMALVCLLPEDKVSVTHGEPEAADAFRRRLRGTFGWDTVVPDDGTTWTLE